MKKYTFLTALFCTAATLCMAELHVEPINITLTEYNLDSIRLQAADGTMYISALEMLQKQVLNDKDRLSLAITSLKAEKQRYKNENSLLNTKKKQIDSQEKIYKKELKLHKNDRKTLEKQRKELMKNEAIDARTQQAQMQEYVRRENRLNQAESDCNTKIFQLQKEREQLKNDMISLAEFKYEIQNKENELKQLQSTNKYQQDNLKSNIKAEKAAQKAAKKNKTN
ncbi:MAG: hypothetical protein NC038_08580 [Paludibacter sp.]|nr:hypothetical protein [Bacteroidales bacterium]MCM1069991.1 hypothetical protein [Prevotella sp.]MCM1354731.1 hypothetical protein [Bacteroides sp.]MCM1443595.1 hypothetical protein [Muribaculum sp.]MCM1482670.1 hypothetical protein [Paludibacter sp.]